MTYIMGNAQDIGKREQQQDAFAFSDPEDRAFVTHGGFLGFVADGMGGMAYGSEASQRAVKAFLQTYQDKSPAESIQEALKEALHEANTAVLSLIGEKGMSRGEVGTTLSAAVIHQGGLYWISVGDSRIYLYRNGKLLLLTESHTIGNGLDRDAALGKISRQEALNHPDREILSSYLGISQLEEIDISLTPYKLQPGDRVVVCSDGLFNTLTDGEIAPPLEGDLQDGCEHLVQKVLSKNDPYQDNVTVIAMGVDKKTALHRIIKGEKKKIPPLFWIIILLLFLLLAVITLSLLKKPGNRGKPVDSPNTTTTAVEQEQNTGGNRSLMRF